MKKFILILLAVITLSACGNYDDKALGLSGYEDAQNTDVVSEESSENVSEEQKTEEVTKKEEPKEKDVKDTSEKQTTEKNETTEEIEKTEEVVSQAEQIVPSEPAVPKEYTISREGLSSDYSEYPNERLSWWYHVPKPLHEEVPARINDDIKNLIEKYDGIWQYPKEQKVVYLTMDEGYEFEDNSTRILDIARDKNVKIAFFVTGDFIRKKPDLVKRMFDEGHIVGNHTNKHLNGVKALQESDEKLINDIVSIESMYRDITGSDLMPFFRPPEGVYSERELKIVSDLGYRAVFWSFAYKDWETDNQPSREYAIDKIVGQLHNGSVLLIHAVSKTNVAILPELIDKIREKGFIIDTIDNIPSYGIVE